jgi:hypothetical protein
MPAQTDDIDIATDPRQLAPSVRERRCVLGGTARISWMTLFSSGEGFRDGRFFVKSAFVDIDLGFRVLNRDGRRIWNGCMVPTQGLDGDKYSIRDGMTTTFMISVIEWRDLTRGSDTNTTPPKTQLLIP